MLFLFKLGICGSQRHGHQFLGTLMAQADKGQRYSERSWGIQDNQMGIHDIKIKCLLFVECLVICISGSIGEFCNYLTAVNIIGKVEIYENSLATPCPSSFSLSLLSRLQSPPFFCSPLTLFQPHTSLFAPPPSTLSFVLIKKLWMHC